MSQDESFLTRYSIVFKSIAIIIITLLLLIPTALVNDLIRERQYRKQDAVEEVSSKWGRQQTLSGPFIEIPYRELQTDNNNKPVYVKKYAHFLPEDVLIKGQIDPSVRHRGIYDIIVYNAELQASGTFNAVDLNALNISPENVLWNEAQIAYGISDLRGIQNSVILKLNEQQKIFSPGTSNHDVIGSGISVPLTLDESKKTQSFSLNLSLKGSELLYFVPTGKETRIELTSSWQHPSFSGAFLPDTIPSVNNDGFSARWKVLNLNRNFPQQWSGSAYNIDESAFGLSLFQPADGYQKSDRSVKYALMIIGLTFLLFFFVEVLNKKPLHPFQYVLVGIAEVIFYSLLISISEHLSFNSAYIISSALTITLITLYTKAVLSSRRIAALMGGTLITLYGFLFTVLQMEDYALLIGSLGIFAILALLMYISRKVDWYNVGKN
jgi:inner membrane protein